MTPSQCYYGYAIRTLADANYEFMIQGDPSKEYKLYHQRFKTMQNMYEAVAQLNLREYDRKREEYYNARIKPHSFKRGDIVAYFRDHQYPNPVKAKFHRNKWEGPYLIMQVFEDTGEARLSHDSKKYFVWLLIGIFFGGISNPHFP